ncbi:MAG: ceramidase [Rhizobiales bacterium]|nr:ceramidase [Hyphomicrobiales bacterium]
MDWFQPIDDYCERLAPGLFAEPWNAVSNASFIAAAILLFLQWRRSQARHGLSLLLIANVFVIGIGSLLFHTFANRWSMLADVLPIAVFIHLYLLLALRSYVSLSWIVAAILTLCFFFLSPALGSWLRPFAGSSAFYVPALLAIFAVAAAVRRRLPDVSNGLFIAGCVFAVSIAFRAADRPLCASWPSGTHLMWHVLNGLVLYLLVRVYFRFTSAPEAH